MKFESVARVRVMGVDCIHVYPFSKIFLVLEYSIYSVFFLEYSVNSVF